MYTLHCKWKLKEEGGVWDDVSVAKLVQVFNLQSWTEIRLNFYGVLSQAINMKTIP